MDVTLRTNARRYVEEKVRSGAYSSPEAVIEAGLAALRQQESFGSFDSGELDSLIAEGAQHQK